MVTWCACVVCFSEIWKDNNLEGMNRAFSNISLWSNFLKNDQLISSLFCPLPYCEKPNLFTFIWLKTVQVASFLKNAFDMLPLHAPISFVKEKFCNIVWFLEINLKIMRQQNRDPYLFATTTHGLLFSLSTGLCDDGHETAAAGRIFYETWNVGHWGYFLARHSLHIREIKKFSLKILRNVVCKSAKAERKIIMCPKTNMQLSFEKLNVSYNDSCKCPNYTYVVQEDIFKVSIVIGLDKNKSWHLLRILAWICTHGSRLPDLVINLWRKQM